MGNGARVVVVSVYTAAPAGCGNREAATKREAVLAFLSEAPDLELKLVEIRRALIGRGWLTHGPGSIHALEVAVAGMAERGEIQGVRKGHYRLRTEAPGVKIGGSEAPGSPVSSSAAR